MSTAAPSRCPRPAGTLQPRSNGAQRLEARVYTGQYQRAVLDDPLDALSGMKLASNVANGVKTNAFKCATGSICLCSCAPALRGLAQLDAEAGWRATMPGWCFGACPLHMNWSNLLPPATYRD